MRSNKRSVQATSHYTVFGQWKSGNPIDFDETFPTYEKAEAFAKGWLKKSKAMASLSIQKVETKCRLIGTLLQS